MYSLLELGCAVGVGFSNFDQSGQIQNAETWLFMHLINKTWYVTIELQIFAPCKDETPKESEFILQQYQKRATSYLTIWNSRRNPALSPRCVQLLRWRPCQCKIWLKSSLNQAGVNSIIFPVVSSFVEESCPNLHYRFTHPSTWNLQRWDRKTKKREMKPHPLNHQPSSCPFTCVMEFSNYYCQGGASYWFLWISIHQWFSHWLRHPLMNWHEHRTSIVQSWIGLNRGIN